MRLSTESHRSELEASHDAMSSGVRGVRSPSCPELVLMLTDLSGRGGYASDPEHRPGLQVKEHTRWR